jgi:hypothetical protein
LRSLADHKPRRSVGVANTVVRTGFTLLPGVFDVLVGPLMRAGGLSRDQVVPHDGNVFVPRPAGDAMHGRWGRHWQRAVGATAVVAGAGAVAAAGRRNQS